MSRGNCLPAISLSLRVLGLWKNLYFKFRYLDRGCENLFVVNVLSIKSWNEAIFRLANFRKSLKNFNIKCGLNDFAKKVIYLYESGNKRKIHKILFILEFIHVHVLSIQIERFYPLNHCDNDEGLIIPILYIIHVITIDHLLLH